MKLHERSIAPWWQAAVTSNQPSIGFSPPVSSFSVFLVQKSKKTTLILGEIRTKDERAASLPVGQRLNLMDLIDRCDPAINFDKWVRACGLADCGRA